MARVLSFHQRFVLVQKKDVMEAFSRLTNYKLAVHVSVVTQMEIVPTHGVSCQTSFLYFYPFPHLNTVCLHSFIFKFSKRQVPEGFQSSFVLEKRAQSIFRERGVAACLILLMEQLIEGSSLRVSFHIFGTFSRRSAASVISLSALYTEAAPLFLCRAAGSHHDFAFASLIFILYNCTVCFVSVCSTDIRITHKIGIEQSSPFCR